MAEFSTSTGAFSSLVKSNQCPAWDSHGRSYRYRLPDLAFTSYAISGVCAGVGYNEIAIKKSHLSVLQRTIFRLLLSQPRSSMAQLSLDR